MSIALMTQVWESELPTSTHKLVLLAFADYADENGMCWPSVERVAARSQVSHRQVQRIAAKLKAIGLLEVLEEGHGHRTSTYIIRGDKLTPLPETGVTYLTNRGDISDIRGAVGDTPRGDTGGTLTTSENHHIEPPEESLGENLSLKEISLRKNYAESQRRP